MYFPILFFKICAGRGYRRGREHGVAGEATMSYSSDAGLITPTLSNSVQPSTDGHQDHSVSPGNSTKNNTDIGIATILQQVVNQITLLTQVVQHNNLFPTTNIGANYK